MSKKQDKILQRKRCKFNSLEKTQELIKKSPDELSRSMMEEAGVVINHIVRVALN